jgi:hypothetical protein
MLENSSPKVPSPMLCRFVSVWALSFSRYPGDITGCGVSNGTAELIIPNATTTRPVIERTDIMRTRKGMVVKIQSRFPQPFAFYRSWETDHMNH